MCDNIDRYLSLNVIGSQGYRSMHIAQFYQFNRFARGIRSIPTACKFIPYCLKQHTYTVYPRLLFEWIPWMIAICTLTYFLPLFQNCRFTTIPSWQYQVLIDRFVRISIDRCCCCWTTETPLTTFFRGYQSYQFLWTYWAKNRIHRQFHPPITGYNKYRC